jgi:formate hydrogenlyase transcriptional activator
VNPITIPCDPDRGNIPNTPGLFKTPGFRQRTIHADHRKEGKPLKNAKAVQVQPNANTAMGPSNCTEGSKAMGLNGLTYPLQYRVAGPRADLETTLHVKSTLLDLTEETVGSGTGFEEIIGRSSGLRSVLQMVETVARGDSTVLLLGETGTGKELIARAIHSHSPRRARPFVKLNCAAIPTGLLESELFGHERGSFTGAIAQKIGRLEVAHQGSLFLDEIGDIPLELQPKLLRVLQEREFERLGSSRSQKVDVRIVAATHRDLEGMILEKLFRSDLYYRLNVFPIYIPPLRERPEDIPLLVQHFVRQAAGQMRKTIDTIPLETMEALTRYRWPGNIRELENVVERSVILSPGPVLRLSPRDLKSRIPRDQSADRHQTLEEVERNHILATLKETRWVLSGPSGAASRLGLNRSTLYFRMKKLGIARSLDSRSDSQKVLAMR